MQQPTSWPVVWVVYGAGIVAATHLGKLPPALPEIRLAVGAGLVTGGWIASMISCTGFALGLFAGGVADRFGQRRVLLFGLAALTVGSLIGAAAHSADVMLASRFIEGIGFTSTTITGPAIISRVAASGDRKWALGVWSSYVPMGFAGMLVAGAAVDEAFGWRTLWVICAVLTTGWAILVAAMTAGWQRRQAGEIAPETIVYNIRRALRVRGALLVAGCFALYAAQNISMMAWLPTYMREVYGADTMVSALVPAAVLLFNAGGNWLSARWMGRGLPTWMLLTGGAVGLALTEIAIFPTVLPDTFRLLFALAFGMFGGMIPAAALGSVPTYAPTPAQIGTMAGLMVTGTNAGQLFGPPALAAARQAAGNWGGVLWLVLALAALGIVLGLLSAVSERRARRSQIG